MGFLRVPLFTLIFCYLLLHLRFCKAYQNCLVALNKITTVDATKQTDRGKTRPPMSHPIACFTWR